MSARRVLLLDTGNEWGGGTNSMLELLKRADRASLSFVVCLYRDMRKGDGDRLSTVLGRLGIETVLLPELAQPRWAKWTKEALRLALAWSARLRKRAIRRIDRAWRANVRKDQVAEVARKVKADLLYLNNQPSSNVEGYLASRLAGLPVVQHCRIDTDLSGDEVRLVNQVATAVICVSKGVRDSMEAQGVDADLLCFVHNGVDLDVADAVLAIPQPAHPFTIGTVGNLMRRKSVDHLLRAAARMKALDESAFRVMVVGDGEERQKLESLAHQLGLAGQVDFTGFLKEPLPAMAAMDVFAFCSLKEGFPRVIIEAMALGKPVVSSNVIGPQEAVEDGTTGFLYEYGDIEKLAALLMALRRDADLRARMGAAGRRRVEARFSVETYVTDVSRILASAGPARAHTPRP